MVDDDDLFAWAVIFNPTSPFGCFVYIIGLIVIFALVISNTEDCAKMHCDGGQPNHECLCVVKAKTP